MQNTYMCHNIAIQGPYIEEYYSIGLKCSLVALLILHIKLSIKLRRQVRYVIDVCTVYNKYYGIHGLQISCMLSLTNSEPIKERGYEVGMAESPSIATVVSAMLCCDLVFILFGDLTRLAIPTSIQF